jgi:hypothetical protein
MSEFALWSTSQTGTNVRYFVNSDEPFTIDQECWSIKDSEFATSSIDSSYSFATVARGDFAQKFA